jgi:DNA repair protein RadC
VKRKDVVPRQLELTDLPKAEPEHKRLLREGPASEQPAARLQRCGADALSLGELLQLVMDSKSDPLVPLRLLNRWATLNELEHASQGDLLQIDGMTQVRVARLRAALEIGKRAAVEGLPERPIIRSPSDAAELLVPEMSGLEQEHMRVLLLNTKNRVIGNKLVYQGSVHTTVIRVSELFRDAVRYNCSAIVVAHSHPSGDPTPSPSDIDVTKEMVQSGKLQDIDLLDHLVIGGAGRWVSLKERGLGF